MGKKGIFDDIKNDVDNKYLKNIDQYVDLCGGERVCLDGYFDVSELELIIKAMKEFNKLIKENIG